MSLKSGVLEIDLRQIVPAIRNFFSSPVSHLLLIVFALHMMQISFPNDGGYVFDETHYVPEAIATLHGIGVNPEHPPMMMMMLSLSR